MNKDLYTTDAFGRSAEPRAIDLEEKSKPAKKSRIERSHEEFFAGYSVVPVLLPGAKRVKYVRQYTGTLYHQELSETQARLIRVRNFLMFICAAGLFVGSLCFNTVSNRTWYVLLAALGTAFFYGRVLLTIHTYLHSKQDMKEYEYKCARQLPEKYKIAAYVTPAPVIATVVLFCLVPGSYENLEIIRLIMMIASGVILLAAGLLEDKTRYTEKPQQLEAFQ